MIHLLLFMNVKDFRPISLTFSVYDSLTYFQENCSQGEDVEKMSI